MFKGCFTAIVTPMTEEGGVDFDGLGRLVEFQLSQGVSGILAVGTTGESPTLDWDEHIKVIECVAKGVSDKAVSIAGTGSNCTDETLRATKCAADAGSKAILLVDPYYNGPSSLEIRREYVEPVAREFPNLEGIPYVIPGRTGTQLLPEDLGILDEAFSNVNAVKEATGNIENMRRTRQCCGEDFAILSGDDDKTLSMMKDPQIRASGVISVASNIAPGAVQKMVKLALEGKSNEAAGAEEALRPLFSIVTVKTQEDSTYGEVLCKARNPLATKTLMRILGMPSGPCRQPLGKMTQKGLQIVLNTAREVLRDNPWVLQPVAEFFNVDIESRLADDGRWKELAYEKY